MTPLRSDAGQRRGRPPYWEQPQTEERLRDYLVAVGAQRDRERAARHEKSKLASARPEGGRARKPATATSVSQPESGDSNGWQSQTESTRAAAS
ncbi:MAG: hypothetical protein WD894_22535 [Pirellulales bacterium]